MPALALEVADVSVSYGKFVAVESVTLSVAAGECVAVIGPNGHGKSSMVTAVAGLVRRGGTVRVFGDTLPPGRPDTAVRAGLILVPERRHLYPDLPVRDNIMLGSYARTRRLGARAAWADVSDVLDMFPELAKLLDQKAGTLSGGQQQMVALARGMAARPYDWLREMTATDMTILLVEENPVHALLVADRSVRMYKGLVEVPGGRGNAA